MCLYKQTPMQVATKDITCYKVIEIHTSTDNKVKQCSYFQGYTIEFGKPILAASQTPIGRMDTIHKLNGEVVHAFISSEISNDKILRFKATTEFCAPKTSRIIDIVLIECTIPKGAYYCTGYDEFEDPNYGATIIIPKRKIKSLATIIR